MLPLTLKLMVRVFLAKRCWRWGDELIFIHHNLVFESNKNNPCLGELQFQQPSGQSYILWLYYGLKWEQSTVYISQYIIYTSHSHQISGQSYKLWFYSGLRSMQLKKLQFRVWIITFKALSLYTRVASNYI